MTNARKGAVLQKLLGVTAVALLLGCGSVMADTPPELPGQVREDSGAVRIFAYRSNVFIVMDVHGRGTDGLVEQWYVLQTDTPPAIELPIELPVARIRHREGVVRVNAPGSVTVYDFVSTGRDATWPEPAPVTAIRVDGYGLSHNTGASTMRIGGRKTTRDRIATADEEGCDVCEPYHQDWGSGSGGGGGATATCQSGGNPSVSCSVSGNNGSCAITCPPGYYSCCNAGGVLTMPACKCYKL